MTHRLGWGHVRLPPIVLRVRTDKPPSFLGDLSYLGGPDLCPYFCLTGTKGLEFTIATTMLLWEYTRITRKRDKPQGLCKKRVRTSLEWLKADEGGGSANLRCI